MPAAIARRDAGVQRDRHLLRRRDVEAVGDRGQVLNHRRHRVRLDRVVQVQGGRQGYAKRRDPRGDCAAIVGIERRAPDSLGQPAHRHSAGGQFAGNDGKRRDGGVLGELHGASRQDLRGGRHQRFSAVRLKEESDS
jgi:hypothetical protein